MRRRSFLVVLLGLAFGARADPLLDPITKGAPVRQGRVKLDMPLLADNGNSVSMSVSVESPMTEADHVRAIHLLSERNPEARMASFHLGPRAGAGSQRVVALAEMSDGSFWMGSASVVVTLSACVDELGS